MLQDHFEESQYESRRMDNLRKLKPNAIPTKFTHFKKNKTLRQIVENLTKTLVHSPLPERHSVEHSYSQSSEKGPTDKEDNGKSSCLKRMMHLQRKPSCWLFSNLCEHCFTDLEKLHKYSY